LLGKLAQYAGIWLAHRPNLQWWLGVLRLGLFQFGLGIALAPVTGTLNRVLIDDLRIPAVAVGVLIALHYFVSPVRALIGYRSDQYRAEGHWRTPYLVFGAMLTYGGLACAPFALILLGSPDRMPFVPGLIICLAMFLAYGIGVNIVETIYLALVSDITPPRDRGRVLVVLWVMLVMGTIVSSVIVGLFLMDYNHIRLIRVMQGTAVVFIILTVVALWGKERLRRDGMVAGPIDDIRVRMTLWGSIRMLARQRVVSGLFAVLSIATLAFATHDVLLEPYGAQVLQMSVAATTQLTALWGVAMLVAIATAGIWLWRGRSAVALISLGCFVGALGFLTISYASDAALVTPFRAGVGLIGMGRGMFLVGSIALIMSMTDRGHAGLFIGVWGVAQALAQGFGTIGGGLARDIAQAQTGSVALGYTFVYAASLGCLAAALVALIVLQRNREFRAGTTQSPWDELRDLPGDQMIA
jgi:BCD family chlorophyll transporter-like MFS transporter